jgi:hypothetical protein
MSRELIDEVIERQSDEPPLESQSKTEVSDSQRDCNLDGTVRVCLPGSGHVFYRRSILHKLDLFLYTDGSKLLRVH